MGGPWWHLPLSRLRRLLPQRFPLPRRHRQLRPRLLRRPLRLRLLRRAAPVAAAVVEETAGPLSPLVRKMARENNIDLSKVKGTGAGGRITKQDLDSYLAARSTPAPVNAAPPPPTAAPPVAAAPPPPPPPPPAAVATIPAQVPVSLPPREAPAPMRGEAAGARIEPMSMMRQKIAEHMVFSKRTSAHVTTVHKVDMTRIAKLRGRVKDDFQARYGFGLTFLPFVMRAASAALQQFPLLNASIDGTNVIYHRDINIGIAVALENGLIVPVIRNADEKNVVGLQRSIVDLASRAPRSRWSCARMRSRAALSRLPISAASAACSRRR